jgi:Domain of unknown function (DUF4349)
LSLNFLLNWINALTLIRINSGAVMKRFSLLILIVLLIGSKKLEVEIPHEPPRGFAELQTTDWFSAMSPEGMIFRIRLIKNLPVQDLQFWSEALTTHLLNEGYVSISTENEFNTAQNTGLFSEWTVPFKNDTYKYLSGVMVSDNSIAVIEAAADHSIYNQHRESIVKNLETIKINDSLAIEITSINVMSSQGNIIRQTTTAAQSEARAASNRSGCFLPGTLILTEDGLIPIENIWPGTIVSSYDPLTDILSLQKVKRNVSLEYSGDIITIGTSDYVIHVTANHPFLISDESEIGFRLLPDELSPSESLSPITGRWVDAGELQPGDILLTNNGHEQKIINIASRIETTQVSYLAVTGSHTYAIEEAGIVVHNAGQEEAAKGELYESYREVNEQEVRTPSAVAVRLPSEKQNERIRVYSGACNLIIDSVEQTKREISLMAENAGGFVEHSSDQGIVVRIPAESFRVIFNRILDLGEVLHKAIETYDVTDQYSDPEGRLVVAIKARDRLYTLLKRVEDVKERLEILKRIRVYTETIEKLELLSQVLEKRVAMSRITVDLSPRLDQTIIIDKSIPFPWIENLRPLSVTTRGLDDRIKISLPDNIAVFQKQGVLRAESANGTRIRIGTVSNNPRGDSLFWQKSLLYHLKSRYKNAEEVSGDIVKMALFTSKDSNPFYYLVGTLPFDKDSSLIAIEVYFPDQEALERHLSDLLESFQKVEIL